MLTRSVGRYAKLSGEALLGASLTGEAVCLSIHHFAIVVQVEVHIPAHVAYNALNCFH